MRGPSTDLFISNVRKPHPGCADGSMKICLLSLKNNFNKDIGQGVQRYMYELWKGLDGIMREPDVLDKTELGFGNNNFVRKASFTLSSLFHDFRGYDIVHTPAPIMYNPKRLGKAQMVTTVHELVLVDDNSAYAKAIAKTKKGFSMADRFGGLVYKKAIKQILNSDHVITTSTLVRDEVVKLGFDRDRISIVNVGIDNRFIIEPKSRKTGKFTVGYLGGHIPRKNVGFAINAFRKIKDPDLEFKIYGKGSEHDNLVKLADGDKRIKFMGFAPENKIVKVYDSFDVLVHPTLYAGFELEIIEAQSRGIPVIICKFGIIPKEVRKYCFEAEDEAHAASIIEDLKENGYDKKKDE